MTLVPGTPAEAATPIRVAVVDVEDGPPPVGPDGRHRWVWLCLRRAGRPRSLVEVDTSDAASCERAVAAVAALSAEPAAAPAPVPHLPAISVVVPTIATRTEDLRTCLESLLANDHPRFEVVLVDNRRGHAGDGALASIAPQDTRLRVVRERRPGISAARNAGVAAAAHDLVAFTDDDVRVDPGWLSALAARFARHPEEHAVTGLVLPAELETPAQLMFERYYGGFAATRTFRPVSFGAPRGASGLRGRSRFAAREEDGQEGPSRPVYGAGACGAGCNMAFRRSALPGPEPFDLALGTGTASRGGEDLAAMVRVLWRGGRIGYEPAALVHHRHRSGYDELQRQMDGYGTGYTAMLTATVLADPRHLAGLAVHAPGALRRLAVAASSRLRGRGVVTEQAGVSTVPPDLARRELRGMLRGPAGYLRSRREARAWRG